MVGPGNHFCGNGCDFVYFSAPVLQRSGLTLVESPAGSVVRDDASPPRVAEHRGAPNVTHTVFSATDMLEMLPNTMEFHTFCGRQKVVPASAQQTLRTLSSGRQGPPTKSQCTTVKNGNGNVRPMRPGWGQLEIIQKALRNVSMFATTRFR